MSIHERARDAWLQAALGELPEGAGAEYLRHISECEACRAYVRSIEEVLGRLPEALPQVKPPPRLRERVLEAVAAERSGEHTERRGRRWLPVAAVWLAVTLGLAWGVVDQGRRLAEQEAAFHALADRYERDVRWLRTAEHILLGARPPDSWAVLEPVTPQAASGAAGKAVVYRAYAEVDYLLLAFDGWLPGAPFDVVWVGPEGTKLLGSGVTDEEGGATYVERLPGTGTTGEVEVRSDGDVVFRGKLESYAGSP